jgi:outer membrane protein assembly factor BamD
VVFLLAGCSKEVPYSERPQHVIYGDGLRKLKAGIYSDAADEFDQFEQQYPYSPWAPKAQLMAAYASYLDNSYTRAIGGLDTFLALHPYHPYASYAVFLRGLCYYEQIRKPNRDLQEAGHAMTSFDELLNRFRTSAYAEPAKKMRMFAYNQLAAHHMTVGRFYQTQQLRLAAFLNFQRVLKDYKGSCHVPEALHRLTDCALSLGVWDEAEGASKALSQRTDAGGWYGDTRTLLASTSHKKAHALLKKLPATAAGHVSPASAG